MRFYEIEKNKKYVSVTSLLGATKDQTFLTEWKKRIGEDEANKITRTAANTGTNLHKKIELYLSGQEDIQSDILFYNILPEIKKIKPQHLEYTVYNHALKIAGTTDCIGYYDDVLSIIDFKSSMKHKRKEWIQDYFLQCTFYSMCFEEMTGHKINQIVVLIASPDECQVFVEDRKHFLLECGQRYVQYKQLNL